MHRDGIRMTVAISLGAVLRIAVRCWDCLAAPDLVPKSLDVEVRRRRLQVSQRGVDAGFIAAAALPAFCGRLAV